MTDTALFAVIRRLLGRGLTQNEVNEINAALFGEQVSALVPHERRTSARGIALIHGFESCKLGAYKDPGPTGLPITIGWGSTTDENGKAITLGTVWSQERADARFAADLTKFENGVSRLLGDTPTSQSQFDALVSFAYNLGLGNLESSTLLKKHKALDYAGAKAQFARWNKAKGKVLGGLTRRRAAEAELYG